MQYTHFVSVAALVWNDSGQILLIKSPDRGWEFPGGMVEPGETLNQALIREIEEETGVKVQICSFSGVSKNIDRDIVNLDFQCRYCDGTPKESEESLEVLWVTPEQALTMVKQPLTHKRLEAMLSLNHAIYDFSFHKQPFEVVEENHY